MRCPTVTVSIRYANVRAEGDLPAWLGIPTQSNGRTCLLAQILLEPV
jgi:hypothetical protein